MTIEPEPTRRDFVTGIVLRPELWVGVISLTNAYLGDGRWATFSDIDRRLFQESS
jgi:hypothetical protein